jgi:hypothetical protein
MKLTRQFVPPVEEPEEFETIIETCSTAPCMVSNMVAQQKCGYMQ